MVWIQTFIILQESWTNAYYHTYLFLKGIPCWNDKAVLKTFLNDILQFSQTLKLKEPITYVGKQELNLWCCHDVKILQSCVYKKYNVYFSFIKIRTEYILSLCIFYLNSLIFICCVCAFICVYHVYVCMIF